MYIDFSNLAKSKPRVLIVDNDPVSQTTYQTLMLFWDYEPILANGTGTALLEDAKKKAKEMRCSIALIDLRLIDDYDNNDMSGLQLAEEMADRLRPIILSGYPNFDALRKMLKKHVVEFVSKTDSRDLIRETLDEVAARVTASKRKLVFEDPEVLQNIASSPLGEKTDGYHDQIADVFAQLFPKAKKLRFEKMEIRPASSNISTVPRPNSIVMKVYEDNFEPVIVKLARAPKIQHEVDNYNQYINRRMTGYFFARLEQSAVLWDIGGAAYSFVGEFDVKPFSRFYEERSPLEIQECLASFFNRIWARHYEQAREVENVSLFKMYSQVWDNWYGKQKNEFFASGHPGIDAGEGKFKFPEPVQWFKEKIAESSNDLSYVPKTRVAITHGDLHGDNLLVDTQKNVWVIDFERCGEGHVLQDFIELEADIFNRLEEHNDNWEAYFKMCHTVLKQTTIEAFEPAEMTSEDPRIEKALHTISTLRELANKHAKITDVREYLYGLLFNMMFRSAMIYKFFPNKKQQSLLLAGLICDRLDHWDEPWSPSGLV